MRPVERITSPSRFSASVDLRTPLSRARSALCWKAGKWFPSTVGKSGNTGPRHDTAKTRPCGVANSFTVVPLSSRISCVRMETTSVVLAAGKLDAALEAIDFVATGAVVISPRAANVGVDCVDRQTATKTQALGKFTGNMRQSRHEPGLPGRRAQRHCRDRLSR